MSRFVFACLALLCLPVAAFCQNGTGISMETGLVLRAAPPRQLTLNANVTQFAYQPGGDSIAYVSVHDDDSRTIALKFIGVHQKDPDTRVLYTVTGDTPDAQDADAQGITLDLCGWSANGRYLMFEQESKDTSPMLCFCEDIGADPFQARPIPLPIPSANGTQIITGTAWSPSRDRFLITMVDIGPPESSTAEIYDPARDKVQPQTIPDGVIILGWLDETHLLFKAFADHHGQKEAYLSHDVATDADMEIAKPAPWPPAHGSLFFQALPSSTTPKLPGLTLETQPQTLKDAQGVAATKAQTIWLRKAKAPRAMSALAVGVTPGTDDPQAQWSPEGDGLAFIGHGDLFVSSLTVQEATPYEKVAAGEKLDCAEEKQVVSQNLRELGLGIIQYCQDNDETFPHDEGFHDAVYPYVKDETIFSFAGVRPIYHAPANLSLAAMDSPADTVLATADTPCAHIVLYADGHVKAFDKTSADAP